MDGLVSLATGAFLGGQQEFWEPLFYEGKPGIKRRMASACWALSELAMHLRILPTICQRVVFGPLAYVNQLVFGYERATSVGRRANHCMHIDDPEQDDVPAIMGGCSRWYVAYPGIEIDDDIESAFHDIVSDIMAHLRIRERARGKSGTQGAKQLGFNVEIYLPPHFMTPGITETFRDELKDRVRQSNARELSRRKAGPVVTMEGDEWRIMSLADAPPCEACGWCADDLQAR
jgi:hypothetical protein